MRALKSDPGLSLSDQAHDCLKTDILSGALEPEETTPEVGNQTTGTHP